MDNNVMTGTKENKAANRCVVKTSRIARRSLTPALSGPPQHLVIPNKVRKLLSHPPPLLRRCKLTRQTCLSPFRSHYHDPSITKWDIFHYIYAVLHHPEYRERYAANLRRELPRIPFVSSPTNCHPERSEHRAAHDARESKDPVLADAEQKPQVEFSAQTSPVQ